VIAGPPGIGRTRLLEEAVAVAGRAGVRCGAGRAFGGAPAVPFAPLLGALFEGAPALFGRDRLEPLRERAREPYWLVQELAALLEAGSRDGPLAVAVDDLQWADPASLLALRSLVPALAHVPVVWLLGLRTGESGGDAEPTVRALAAKGARRLALRPLDDGAVDAVVADVIGGDAAPEARAHAARARGNPFLLVELLVGLRDEGLLDAPRVPARLRGSMRERLDRLRPDTRRVLLVGAVLGRRFPVAWLASMLDRPPSALLDALEEALDADLLCDDGDHLSFRHDLLHEAVLETLAEPVRRGLHRQAAAVLGRAGAGPLAVAAHLAVSAEPGDTAAAAVLREAARELRPSDPGRAAQLGLRALDLTRRDDPTRGAIVAEIVLLLHAALRGEEADALARDALDGALPSEQEAEVLLSLGGLNMRSPDARAADNRRALALPGISPRMRARHLAALTLNTMTGGRFLEAGELVGRALRAGRACADDAAIGSALFAQATMELPPGRFATALEVLEDARRHLVFAGRDLEVRALDVTRARMLADLGRRDEAMRLSADGAAATERQGHAWLHRLWLVWRSQLLLEAGRLADARAEAEAARALPGGDIETLPDAYATLVLARVALHAGDAARVDAYARHAHELLESGTPKVRRFASWLLAQVHAARAEYPDAVRRLADDELPYAVPVVPAEITHPPLVARMALAAGDRALAERAVEVAERYERATPGDPLLQASAAHARGLLDGDAGRLTEAVGLYRRGDRPLALAEALEDAARALAAEGRPEPAVRSLGDALAIWARAGAEADAARVRGRLRALGVRGRVGARSAPRDGWDGLTASELAVVRLVAQGHTNRDAADRLFLSPHTVSSHLRHAFAKLGINSRVELARIVVERDRPSVASA
jgi:DNA-binding CsgD family transcriptional regulator